MRIGLYLLGVVVVVALAILIAIRADRRSAMQDDCLGTLRCVEAGGDVVPKADLMARVWPDTAVQDANLSVTVAALRRVLEDLKSGVEGGEDFSTALARHPKLFDRTYVSLVRAAEAIAQVYR